MADKPGKKVHGKKAVDKKQDPLDVPMYDVVAYQEANLCRELDSSGGYCNPAYTKDPCTPGYTSIGSATKNRESVYTTPAPAVQVDAGNQIEKVTTKESIGQSKKLVCAAMAVFAALVLLVIVGLLVYLYLQVSSLKNELASSSTASQLEQLESSSMQQQLNNSIVGVHKQLREELAGFQSDIMQQLNDSIGAINDQQEELANFKLVSENWLSDHDIKINLLNTSIGELPLPTGLYSVHPAASCAALPLSFPSGYYWVRASNGSAVLVYCDMTRSCGGVIGRWRRVAYLDMTNSSHQCPNGLRQRIDSNQRTCVKNSDLAGCSSVLIPSAAVEYSRLCGRIIGYQVGTPEPFFVLGGGSVIDNYYVNGISLTHGNPRQHIWTFAAGPDEVTSRHICPCAGPGVPVSPPPAFVGNDYFCDTGSRVTYQSGVFYGADPLWDGAGCGSSNTCCSFNDPPWFHKQLPQPTTDDIEMRVCRDQERANEDVAIEIIEIYVQ